MERPKKTEVVCSLPLQISLYFNCFFSPWWIITHICTLTLKFEYLSVTYQVIIVTIHAVAIALEPIRLYLGYVGNLMERTPQLAGFWIATLILQLPLTSFLLLHDGLLILPLERGVDIVHLAFVIFEVIAGFMAVRRVTRYQVAKFHQEVLAKQQPNKSKLDEPVKLD